MTAGVYDNVLKRLARRELILPIFENRMLGELWPDSYVVTIDSKKHTPTPGYFHPSVHPLMGARELYYRMHPATRDLMVPERRTAEAHMGLAVHSAVHGIVQTQMQMAGLVRPENIEWRYVDEAHKVRGRIDFIVDHPSAGQLVVELKGQNPRASAKQTVIKPEWDAQGSLAADHYGTDQFVLMVVEMGWPFKLKEYVEPKNTALLEEIYAKFDYVWECIARDTPPKHCCSSGSETMKRCVARFSCWLSEENNGRDS